MLAFLTTVLLIAGGLVTSNAAGDSVPDWPLSFGRWLIGPEYFVANVRYEYSHRFIAGIVGGATLVLAVWTWLADKRWWMRWVGLVALLGVVAQAVIGGVRVQFPAYKPLIAVPHALVAQSFFGLVVGIAVLTSRSWWEAPELGEDTGRPRLCTLTSLTVGAVLVQLVLGAGFRHQAFGIIPHVVGAAAVVALTAWTVVAIWRRCAAPYLRRPALVLLILVPVQLQLGIAAYLARLGSRSDPQPLEPMISLTVAHLTVGALTLAAALSLTLRCHRALARREGTGEVPRNSPLTSPSAGGTARRGGPP